MERRVLTPPDRAPRSGKVLQEINVVQKAAGKALS